MNNTGNWQAMQVHFLVSGILTPCGDAIGYRRSEDYTASIFKVKWTGCLERELQMV